MTDRTARPFTPSFFYLRSAAKAFAALHPAHTFTSEEHTGPVVVMQGVECCTLSIRLVSNLPGHVADVFTQTIWADGDRTPVARNGRI